MNFTTTQAGTKQQVKANGKVKRSSLYKNSRLRNLSGSKGGPAAGAAAGEGMTNGHISSLTSTPSVYYEGHGTSQAHRKMSRELFEEETKEEEESLSREAGAMEVIVGPVLTSPTTTTNHYHASPLLPTSLATTSSPPLPHAAAFALPAGPVPVQPAVGDPIPGMSRQKEFSKSGKSSQRSIISSVYNGLKESARHLLQRKGRAVETDADIGHILQHAGGRLLNESTTSRGNIEALDMLHIFQAKPVAEMPEIAADLPAEGSVDASARRWERYAMAKSALVQNLVKTYTQAAQNVPGKETRARVLSALAESFSLKELNTWVFGLFGRTAVKISKHAFKTARLHALGCGAGNVPTTSKIVRRRVNSEDLRIPDGSDSLHTAYVFCTEFVQTYLTPLAFGTRKSTLSNGEVLELNKIERTRSKEEIKKLYVDACEQGYDADANGQRVPIGRVPDKHFDTIIDTLSGGAENASLAALDSVYCKFGLQNFELFRRFIKIITAGRPEVEVDLTEKCLCVETFLRKEYADHIFDMSSAASH